MKKIFTIFLLFFVITGVGAIDSSEVKTYSTSEDFLNAQGDICESATDGCNYIGITNGKLGAMTEMYCEDIYGVNGQEKWSCTKYNEERVKYNKYITDNISNLSDVEPVLGGTWYVVDIDWVSDDEIKVTYEDGHIQEEMTLNKSDLNIEEDVLMCTMEYLPVCAEVQVQCIRAPCPPIMQTFGNACGAGKNNIIYTGECDSKVNLNIYKELQQRQERIKNILGNLPTITLNKAKDLADALIPLTKMLKISDWIIEQRITKYVFLRELVREELMGR